VKFQQFKPRLSVEYFATQASLLFTFGLSLQAFIRIKMNRMYFNLITTNNPSLEVRIVTPTIETEISNLIMTYHFDSEYLTIVE